MSSDSSQPLWSPRARFHGSVEDVAATLAMHVQKAHAIQYKLAKDDKGNDKSPFQANKIDRVKDLMAALHQVCRGRTPAQHHA